jgi:hypothetical protein
VTFSVSSLEVHAYSSRTSRASRHHDVPASTHGNRRFLIVANCTNRTRCMLTNPGKRTLTTLTPRAQVVTAGLSLHSWKPKVPHCGTTGTHCHAVTTLKQGILIMWALLSHNPTRRPDRPRVIACPKMAVEHKKGLCLGPGGPPGGSGYNGSHCAWRHIHALAAIPPFLQPLVLHLLHPAEASHTTREERDDDEDDQGDD